MTKTLPCLGDSVNALGLLQPRSQGPNLSATTVLGMVSPAPQTKAQGTEPLPGLPCLETAPTLAGKAPDTCRKPGQCPIGNFS